MITDLGVLEPDPVTCELTVTALHPDVTVEQVDRGDGLGGPLRGPRDHDGRATDDELSTLGALQAF